MILSIYTRKRWNHPLLAESFSGSDDRLIPTTYESARVTSPDHRLLVLAERDTSTDKGCFVKFR